MTYRFTHARLLVSEFEACFAFYRDVLGLEVVWGDGGSHYADFQSGNFKLALFGRQPMADVVGTGERPADADYQDRVALIFAVEDVDRAYRRLADKGVTFVTEPMDRPGWGVKTAHFRDPDGNLIEINEEL